MQGRGQTGNTNQHIADLLSSSYVFQPLLILQVKIVNGNFELLRVLDVMPPSVKSDCTPGQFTLTIFFNDMWNLNNYGQVRHEFAILSPR